MIAFSEFTVIPLGASISYKATYNPSLPDPTLITFDQSSREFTVFGSDVTWANMYQIVVKAYDVFDNEVATDLPFQFNRGVRDPCKSSVLKIDDDDITFPSNSPVI